MRQTRPGVSRPLQIRPWLLFDRQTDDTVCSGWRASGSRVTCAERKPRSCRNRGALGPCSFGLGDSRRDSIGGSTQALRSSGQCNTAGKADSQGPPPVDALPRLARLRARSCLYKTLRGRLGRQSDCPQRPPSTTLRTIAPSNMGNASLSSASSARYPASEPVSAPSRSARAALTGHGGSEAVRCCTDF